MLPQVRGSPLNENKLQLFGRSCASHTFCSFLADYFRCLDGCDGQEQPERLGGA